MKDQSIKDILGGGIKFHSELPRMKKEELVGVTVTLWDARVIDDWDSQYGTTKFALLAMELEGGERITSLCGGKAVVRQVEKLQRLHKLPGRIRCFLNVVEGPNGDYYLLDSEAKNQEPAVVAETVEETEEAQPVEAVS